ncbi:hypothetical protein GmRootV59_54050 (plasmid) [Variovorax sp. V59]
MNLSPRQIRYVCEVARLGSIQAAASAVHISQSSIVAAIDIAEDALGAKIFDRRPARGVQITPTGERFVTAARGLLAANGAFEREIGVLAQGTPQVVRIGCFEPFGSLFIAEVLKVYADRYGPVEIELVEGDQRQLRDWLANGSVDLIITYEIGPSFEEDCMTKICKVPAHVILPGPRSLGAQRGRQHCGTLPAAHGAAGSAADVNVPDHLVRPAGSRTAASGAQDAFL